MSRRTLPLVLLTLLAVFLLGAFAVLSAFSSYFAIPPTAYLTEPEVFAIQRHDPVLNHSDSASATTATAATAPVPKILHQTWRSDILPERWRVVSQGCKDLMPD